jgi:hypothetical protein
VTLAAAPPLVEDARILVTTERPEDFWYVLPLFVVLAFFALLFGYGYWRGLRA